MTPKTTYGVGEIYTATGPFFLGVASENEKIIAITGLDYEKCLETGDKIYILKNDLEMKEEVIFNSSLVCIKFIVLTGKQAGLVGYERLYIFDNFFEPYEENCESSL